MKILALWLFCCFLSVEAWAKTDFEVVVPAEAVAGNSVEAKDLAMMNAQKKAFLEVASRFVKSENLEKLQTLSDTEILYFIQAVSVADEKAGGNKYKATLTVQINEPLLKDYLAENEMIQTEAKELAVIPVYRAQSFGEPLLWEKENAWRNAWASKGLVKFGTMQVRTVSEVFKDIANFTAEGSLYMQPALYDELSFVLTTDKIYVIYAETLKNGDLKVTVKNEKNKSENSFMVYDNGDENLIDKAIEQCVMFISNMERDAENMNGEAPVGSVNAVYSYLSMKDWLTKSAAISALPQVESIDTKSFGGGKVSFTITFNGTLDDLWEGLRELGLSHDAVDNYYILR